MFLGIIRLISWKGMTKMSVFWQSDGGSPSLPHFNMFIVAFLFNVYVLCDDNGLMNTIVCPGDE